MKGEAQRLPGGEPAHRKALTRERILEAATDSFVARGYERTTIARVASRAGVSRAAVFWHFGDKQSLFREVVSRLLTPFRLALEETEENLDPEKRLVEMFSAYERFVADHREAIQAFLRWMMEEPDLRSTLHESLLSLQASFERDLRATLDDLRPPVEDAAALAAGLVALLDGTLMLSLLSPQSGRDVRRAGLRAVLSSVLQRERS
jgi:AcrR family transcriptional regulator